MAIGDPYNSRTAFKAALSITATDEDDFIDVCINAARQALEKRSGWPTFWNTDTAVEREVEVYQNLVRVTVGSASYYKLLLPRDGIASADGFSVSGISGARLLPYDSIDDGNPADSILLPLGSAPSATGTLLVTAVWGWPSVPSDIIWAHQMQSNRYYRRKGSPEGVAGSAEWGLTRIPALDPDVLAILKGGGYMRAGIA